jgi:hypothetical protein
MDVHLASPEGVRHDVLTRGRNPANNDAIVQIAQISQTSQTHRCIRSVHTESTDSNTCYVRIDEHARGLEAGAGRRGRRRTTPCLTSARGPNTAPCFSVNRADVVAAAHPAARRPSSQTALVLEDTPDDLSSGAAAWEVARVAARQRGRARAFWTLLQPIRTQMSSRPSPDGSRFVGGRPA